jgi:hypothetical protein
MMKSNWDGRPRTATEGRGLGRFELFNAFWDMGTVKSLTRTEAMVWLALWRHARPDRTVQLSFRKVAEMVGTRRDTAYKTIRALRKKRLLVLSWHGGAGRGPNVYKLLPYDPTN